MPKDKIRLPGLTPSDDLVMDRFFQAIDDLPESFETTVSVTKTCVGIAFLILYHNHNGDREAIRDDWDKLFRWAEESLSEPTDTEGILVQ